MSGYSGRPKNGSVLVDREPDSLQEASEQMLKKLRYLEIWRTLLTRFTIFSMMVNVAIILSLFFSPFMYRYVWLFLLVSWVFAAGRQFVINKSNALSLRVIFSAYDGEKETSL